jgi:hypothetical protein
VRSLKVKLQLQNSRAFFHFALSFHRDTFSESPNKFFLFDCIEKRHDIAILAIKKKKAWIRSVSVWSSLSCAFVQLLHAFASKSNELQKLISLRIDVMKTSKH